MRDSNTEVREAKQELRGRVSEALRQMTPEQQAAASAEARARLEEQEHWRQARSILFYAPMTGELDVWPLLVTALAAGKVVALPRYVAASRSYVACQVQDLARDVAVGFFGIREPTARCEGRLLNRLDLLLVPGVAFDLHGRRLGRGKGYYDRLLAAVSGTTCGVAFDEQVVRDVPVGPQDRHLNCLLTPTRWLEL